MDKTQLSECSSLWAMVRAIPLACCAVNDENNEIIFSNQEFIKLWHLEHMHKNLLMGIYMHQDFIDYCSTLVQDVENFREGYKLLHEKSESTKEDLLILKDGRTIRRNASLMLDAKGKKFGHLYMFKDLTKHIEFQNRLHEKQMEYRNLYMNSPAVMMVVDSKTGKIVKTNQAAANYYGYTAEQLDKMSIYSIEKDDRLRVDEMLQEIINSEGKSFYSEHRLVNGEIRNVEIFACPFQSLDKLFINSIIFDVTEKMQNEKKLKENHERLSLILDGARAGTWEVDLIEKTAHQDSRCKAIVGYNANEVIDWHSLIHPEDVDRVDQAIKSLYTKKSDVYALEYRLRHKDGTYRWVYSTCSKIYDQQLRPIRYLGLILDITQRKKLEELISESEKRLKDFAQAIPELTAIIDEDGRYIEVFGHDNQFLYPPETMRGHTVYELFPPDLAQTMLNHVRKAITNGEVSHMLRGLNMGTEKRYFEGRTAPMDYKVNGKKTAVLLVSDITQRIRIEQTLRFTYELRRRSDFINDRINGDTSYDDKTLAIAKEWGIDLKQSLFCCIIQCQDIDLMSRGSKLSPNGDLKLEIVRQITEQMKVTVWENRNNICILCHDEERGNEREKTQQTALQIKQVINEYVPNLTVTIAISDSHCKMGSVKKCYQEAWNTLLASKCLSEEEGGIFHFRDIGLFQILAAIDRKDDKREFVENNIGPLISYDQQKGTDLLNTLEKILKSNNLRQAAEELFIHRKTLMFRKQRIEKLLSISLDNYQIRLALSAAIMIYKLNKIV
ncbi:PAS domain S-box protein [Desulfosporosinus sp. FKA]|uniref:PAS domain S-box protein n=1 Tax=Desulfosporosinus sp. FKA TaxID=1969834 RepID=UPI000B49FEFB|nr:PAS domain S-box protein [Desulfosporosinus sp. FKA]